MSQQITAQIRRLVAAFPQPATSAETVAVYIDALSDMDPDVLAMAVDVVIRSDDWFPKIKRLRTACEDLQYAQLSAADDRQWVVRYINGSGNGYDPVTGLTQKPTHWPNPVLEEAVRLFGWQRIHEANPEYFARDWERAWNQARELVMKRAAAGELAGAVLPDGAARPALKAVS